MFPLHTSSMVGIGQKEHFFLIVVFLSSDPLKSFFFPLPSLCRSKLTATPLRKKCYLSVCWPYYSPEAPSPRYPDCEVQMRLNCAVTETHLRRNCTLIAQQLHRNCAPIMQQLRPNCAANAPQLCSIPGELHPDYTVTTLTEFPIEEMPSI